MCLSWTGMHCLVGLKPLCLCVGLEEHWPPCAQPVYSTGMCRRLLLGEAVCGRSRLYRLLTCFWQPPKGKPCFHYGMISRPGTRQKVPILWSCRKYGQSMACSMLKTTWFLYYRIEKRLYLEEASARMPNFNSARKQRYLCLCLQTSCDACEITFSSPWDQIAHACAANTHI